MTATAAVSAPPADSRRWAALVFIALAQLMVVLDATVVNIALPSAQKALGISAADRQWVITAYTLVFGGLLLFGGRIADLVGRKRTFLIGLVGFAGASAIGGAATGEEMLFGARALQGAFGALLAPSALSLLAVSFTQPRERAKAFGIYGAIAGGGAAVGLMLGGVLTEYLDWRWALYVNVPIAVVAFVGALILVRVPPAAAAGRRRRRLDLPGAVLVTGGLVALVYGFTRAESEGWRERGVLALFGAAAVLIILFVVVEAVSRAPLLPLRVVTDRRRGGSYIAVGLAVIAMFGLFLFLTYYLQVVRGYSPVKTGLAFLPFTAGMITGSTQISARLMHRVPARALMVPGLLLAATGMWLLTHLRVGSSYTHLVMPSEVMISLGLGTTMMPAMNLATTGVAPYDAGVASAMVNTAQQVGGSIGTALLNTIAATATTRYIDARAHGRPSPPLAAAGQVHGYAVAIWWSAGIMLITALLVAVIVKGRPQATPGGAHAAGGADGGRTGPDARPELALSSVGAAGHPHPGAGTAPVAAGGQPRRAADAFAATEPTVYVDEGERRAWHAGVPYERAHTVRPPRAAEPEGTGAVSAGGPPYGGTGAGSPSSGPPDPHPWFGQVPSGGANVTGPRASGDHEDDGTRPDAAPAGGPPYGEPDTWPGAASLEAVPPSGRPGGQTGAAEPGAIWAAGPPGSGDPDFWTGGPPAEGPPGSDDPEFWTGGAPAVESPASGGSESWTGGIAAVGPPGSGDPESWTGGAWAEGPPYAATRGGPYGADDRAGSGTAGASADLFTPDPYRPPEYAAAAPGGTLAAGRDAADGPGGDAAPSEVRGSVHGAGGVPLPGAMLTLVDLGGRQLGRAVSDANGAYALPAPGPGAYVLIATGAGHRPRAVTVVLGDGSLVHRLTLDGTAGLAGVVRAERDGAPIAGAVVVLADTRGEIVASAETDHEGTFAFHDLLSGTLTLAASAPGHRPAAIMVRIEDDATAHCEVPLSAGATLRGTVRAGAEGRPLGDARVMLVNAAGDVVAATVTGPDGTYTFDDLDSGSYTVIAGGYPPVARAMTVDGSDRSGADITLGHTVGPSAAHVAPGTAAGDGGPGAPAPGDTGTPGGGTVPPGPGATGDDGDAHR